MSTTTYPTLDAALDAIAARSFCESARVYRDGDAFTVEDWYTGVDESAPWSYADGLTLPTGTLDYSRVHGPAEHYATAAHIRYNLPAALEALEAGESVGFTYVIADDTAPCEECDDDAADGCQHDRAAGWALIATPEP